MKHDPVFLIGFPRSGTTLLDTILRTHTSIKVLEETVLVDNLIQKLVRKLITIFQNYIIWIKIPFYS